MTCRCAFCTPDVAPTYTEAHRHACEVRYVVAMLTGFDRSRYLRGVGEERGKQARERIVDALKVIAAERVSA